MRHRERHRSGRLGWLRAAVLGANDGLISTASLIVGVAAAQATPHTVLLTGVAGLTAGALSMAAGEYVSVRSQADTEQADMRKERHELATQPEAEHAELAAIYVQRGLSPTLAGEVATQLMAHDPLGAHLRDELGISEDTLARPLQAACASAVAFSLGALPPILLALLWPSAHLVWILAITTLLLLGGLGMLAASLGGAPIVKGALRVMFWGALALAVTATIGRLLGVSPVA